MTGHQRQQQGRQKLKQADQTQVPGTAGQLVHLPAHGDHQHLLATDAGQPRIPKAHEVRLAGQVRKVVQSHGAAA
jgi:hypothetical protein